MNPLFALCTYLIISATPSVDVVYPRPMPTEPIPTIDYVDSNFIFGSVKPPSSSLSINGHPVTLDTSGAFIAFLPVDWKRKQYKIIAFHEGDTTRLDYQFVGRKAKSKANPPPKRQKFPVRLKLTGGTARNDPEGSYYVFIDPDTKVTAVDWRDGFYQIAIGDDRSVWIPDEFAVILKEPVKKDKPCTLHGVKVEVDSGNVVVRMPIGEKVLYRCWDEINPTRIVIDLYNVIGRIEQVSYPPGSGYLTDVRWEEPYDRTVRLTISTPESLLTADPFGSDTTGRLAGKKINLLGYETGWDGGTFLLRIKKKPLASRGLAGWRITLDPGHGGSSDGAIGPLRLTEKEANLRLVPRLKERLEQEGAEVMLTRTDDRDVGLTERITFARGNRTHIFLSLHHNALPDGRNPFGMLGTGVYYYRPQSRTLAGLIGRELVNEFGLPDEGIYYKNLAVCRPTDMIAVLIESAYMMLPEQEALIRSDGYPDRYAEAVTRALLRYVE